MPQHTTQHWTDGDGIGRKLRAMELHERLRLLSDTANKEYREAEVHRGTINAAWELWLEHARKAGEALLEAKRRLGHRSKWSKWRNRNFEGSKETSCHYMRVAREWDNPIVVEARKAGLINSINAFNKLIRAQPLAAKKPKTTTERERIENQVVKHFTKCVIRLDAMELQLLSRSDMQAFDSMWERMHGSLKDAVGVIYGDDGEKPDKTQDEPKRAVRAKVTQALNKRHTRATRG